MEHLWKEKRREEKRREEEHPPTTRKLPNGYDFHWSSCVIEHLGSLRNIKSFLIESAKKLKQGIIDLATYHSEIAALNLSDTDTSHLKYMTTTLAAQYQLSIAREDTVLTLNGEVLPDLE